MFIGTQKRKAKEEGREKVILGREGEEVAWRKERLQGGIAEYQLKPRRPVIVVFVFGNDCVMKLCWFQKHVSRACCLQSYYF